LKWNIIILFVIFLLSFFIIGYIYESTISSLSNRVDLLHERINAWQTKYFRIEMQIEKIQDDIVDIIIGD
jgi:predicted PurR-regulated permease PerM